MKSLLQCRLCSKERQTRPGKVKGKSPIPHTETYLKAATDTAVVKMVFLVSFPPNPPPILFTRTTILFDGTPSALATNS